MRIFPNRDSALRAIRALAVEMHEDWIEEHRYLNMEELCAGRRWAEGAQASSPAPIEYCGYSFKT